MVFYGDTAEARSKSREDSLPAFPKQLGTRSITGSYTRQYFNVYKTEDGKFIRPSVEADTDRQQNCKTTKRCRRHTGVPNHQIGDLWKQPPATLRQTFGRQSNRYAAHPGLGPVIILNGGLR